MQCSGSVNLVLRSLTLSLSALRRPEPGEDSFSILILSLGLCLIYSNADAHENIYEIGRTVRQETDYF